MTRRLPIRKMPPLRCVRRSAGFVPVPRPRARHDMSMQTGLSAVQLDSRPSCPSSMTTALCAPRRPLDPSAALDANHIKVLTIPTTVLSRIYSAKTPKAHEMQSVWLCRARVHQVVPGTGDLSS
ncbi:hypothetical protein BS50DRAFT_593805 [Corynespora cassiicola Philippines]|uniref:Uncharacterized protein n=1 Tax=Corynespora cassiicola Philippines TaxID=1448308 RepID=A0A2T2N5R4_CORCC|nr:hypothetical protein BS50DRAFT_593805 [Corynespora cassiicola Philippines]